VIGRPFRRECEYRATAQTPSSRELRREGSDSSPRPVARQPRRTPYFDSGTQSNPCPVREPLRGCCRVETAVGQVQARGFDRHRRGRCIRDIQVAVRCGGGFYDAPTATRPPRGRQPRLPSRPASWFLHRAAVPAKSPQYCMPQVTSQRSGLSSTISADSPRPTCQGRHQPLGSLCLAAAHGRP